MQSVLSFALSLKQSERVLFLVERVVFLSHSADFVTNEGVKHLLRGRSLVNVITPTTDTK